MSEPATDPFGFSVLGRRKFLRLGVGAVVLAGGGFAAARAIGGSAPPVAGLVRLGDRQAKILGAIVHTLLPPGGAVVNEAALVRMPLAFDRFVQSMPPDLGAQLGLAMYYVELAPVFLDLRLDTFSQLEPAAREQHWRKHWELTDNDLRRGVGSAFRRLSCLWCYDNETLWPKIHYPGPLLQAVQVE